MNKRVLIVGSGSIAKKHLEVANFLIPDAEFKVLSIHGKSEIDSRLLFSNKQDALDFKPAIAVIANPSSMHLSIAKDLAISGVHLLVEKPISNDLIGVNEFINECRKSNSVLMVGYNLRFSDSLNYFRSKLEKYLIGKPLIVKSEVGSFLPTWRTESPYENSVSAKRNLGGGVLLELSHEIDYLEWIFGSIQWTRATVMRQSSLKIDVEDSAILTFGIKNSNNSNLVANLSLDFIRHDHVRNCLVVGELGSLKWDGIKQEVSVFEKGAKDWKLLFTSKQSTADTYVEEWRDFLHSIDTGDSPRASGIDGLNALQVIQAIRLSAPSGQQTSIDRN
jgi:predicted dehydrogenase